MTEHPIIWLQADCGGCNVERCWCQHDMGPCEECGAPCVKYVLAPDQPKKPEPEPEEDD